MDKSTSSISGGRVMHMRMISFNAISEAIQNDDNMKFDKDLSPFGGKSTIETCCELRPVVPS